MKGMYSLPVADPGNKKGFFNAHAQSWLRKLLTSIFLATPGYVARVG